MAFRARGAEKENQGLKKDKPISKSICSGTRPVLGDLGNKINGKQKQDGTKRIGVKADPPVIPKAANGVMKKPTNVDTQRREITGETAKIHNSTKGINNCDKKTIQNKDILKLQSIPPIDDPSSYSSKQLGGITNIDTSNNPLLVSEYIQDIYKYLLELENKFCIKSDFLFDHRTTPQMRAVLVDWMVDVQQDLDSKFETLHLSVAIVDRYLQLNKKVGRKNLQLVGATAFWIAFKYEETCVPYLTEFVYSCNNAFTMKQFLEMERELLKTLEFELGRPISLQFLKRFSKIAGVNAEHHHLGKYLIELALMKYELCYIKPSLLAAAACCLSVTLLNKLADPHQAWTSNLVYYSNYKYRDIKTVLSLLASALIRVKTSQHKAIYTKYSLSANGKISLNLVLDSPILSKLASQSSTTNKK